MVTAFVLAGGCSLGAVQVGMLQALAEHRVVPDLLVGTSAGALNAAYAAGHGTDAAALDRLGAIWTGLRRSRLFPFRPGAAVRLATGGSDALCSDAGLRHLVRRHLPFTELEQARIPLHVVATSVLDGQEVLLSTGSAEDAVVASCAIPLLLPPVQVAGRHLVDGGLADNTAISQAVALGADRVFVLPAGYPCALAAPPRGLLGVAAHALTLLTHQRLVSDIARFSDRVDLRVLPPPCPLQVVAHDFSQAGTLITRARAAARVQLDQDAARVTDPAALVALHHHPSTAPAVVH